LDQIDSVLFKDTKNPHLDTTTTTTMNSECLDWAGNFPHLRYVIYL